MEKWLKAILWRPSQDDKQIAIAEVPDSLMPFMFEAREQGFEPTGGRKVGIHAATRMPQRAIVTGQFRLRHKYAVYSVRVGTKILLRNGRKVEISAYRSSHIERPRKRIR